MRTRIFSSIPNTIKNSHHSKMSDDPFEISANMPEWQEDAAQLVHWLYEHDKEWLMDACWLRYQKVSSVVYSRRWRDCRQWSEAEVKSQREAYAAAQKEPRTCDLPFANAILPPPSPSASPKQIDRLSALPHDTRVEILSYLLLPDCRVESGPDIDFQVRFGGHNLNRLALVSRFWRDQVEAFCSHFLLVWKQIVAEEYTCGDSLVAWDSWVDWERLHTYTLCARMEYVHRALRYCAYCGRDAKRCSSGIWVGLVSCGDCCKVERSKLEESVRSSYRWFRPDFC